MAFVSHHLWLSYVAAVALRRRKNDKCLATTMEQFADLAALCFTTGLGEFARRTVSRHAQLPTRLTGVRVAQLMAFTGQRSDTFCRCNQVEESDERWCF